MVLERPGWGQEALASQGRPLPAHRVCWGEREQKLETLWASASASAICKQQSCSSIHPLKRQIDQLFVHNTVIQCFCFQKPRVKGQKKENMDLAAISTIDAAPAAGFITLARFRCASMNSALCVYWLFSLIPLMLALILPIDFSFPPTHLFSFSGTLMLAASCMFQRQDPDKAAPAGQIFVSPPSSCPIGSGNVVTP